MTNFKFQEMFIISHKNKRARSLRFHPRVTLIKGPNDTGKSSIVKTIYWTFGAEPLQSHPKWEAAAISSLVRFTVNGLNYSVYRHKNTLSLFGNGLHHVATSSNDKKPFRKALARLLSFDLLLPNRQGDTVTAPPSYQFLPFYIDQDGGWIKGWHSFKGLGRLAGWRRELASYYAGLRPKSYYRAKAELRVLKQKEKIAHADLTALQGVRERIVEDSTSIEFNPDVSVYKGEIDLLLKKCRGLRRKQNIYRNKMTQLGTEKIRLQTQKKIIQGALSELNQDYIYATEKLDETVACPTCGAEYANNFSARFEIATDEGRCFNLLSSINAELERLDQEISKHRDSLQANSTVLESASKRLKARQDKITLQSLIEIESRRQLEAHLEAKTTPVRESLNEAHRRIKELRQKVRNLERRELKEKIRSSFMDHFSVFLRFLNVEGISPEDVDMLDGTLKEIGSDLPRALLAFVYAFLHIIDENEDATLCPIVIDSPNQQDQDSENLPRILDFLKKRTPTSGQLVLSLVDDCGIDFGGTVVNLADTYSALSPGEYETVANIIRPFEERNLFGA